MEEAHRQLSVIMFTDVEGYTALMGKDQDKALQLLEINRDIQKPLISEYGGSKIKWITASMILLLIIILYSFDLFTTKSSTNDPTTEEKTLAVLAFDNIGGDDTNEYFSLGITEDIIVQLSKIKDLKVIDRSYLRK